MGFTGIPLPKVLYDEEAPGGIGTAMKGWNAVRHGRLENQIKKAEALYAPYTQHANAASKEAYSQFVGPQSIAHILSDPRTRGMLSDDQYKKLLGAFSNQLGPGNALANLPNPNQMQNNQFGNGILGMALNAVRDLFQGNKQNPQNQNSLVPSQQQQQPPQSQVMQQGGSQNNTGDFGANNRMSDQQLDEKLRRLDLSNQSSTLPANVPLAGTSPTYGRQSANLPPGVMGAQNPYAIITSGEKGLEKQVESEAQAITDQWKSRQDEIREAATGAQEIDNNLDRLDDSRERLGKYEKGITYGIPFGQGPAFTTASQESDLASNNLVAAKLSAWQRRQITNKDLDFGKMLKAGRYMTDDAYKAAVNYDRAMSARIKEYPAFALRAQQLGLTPAQFDAILFRYANERPLYNAKTKEIISENLNTWEDYLTEESIKETFSPNYKKQREKNLQNMAGGNKKDDEKILKQFDEIQNQKPKNVKEAIKKEGDRFRKETIPMWWINPTTNKREEYNVPQEHVQEFIDNGFKRLNK
jgi:hypothetical protein